ncbi:helix-turn-helix transcriptional regulator [Adhaeribacter swui]|uniref:Helix-turn-helix transcriptional regulator n=1 Tax=Adhaeribacter swui TaxID=2086471 RepID=A0A7G7GC50_9BACT|nr:helix-turn-helix transcriptional regulator [Adhaeribacter swui]QNF34734.1 helix-turn-helix transcriptional regulator [Adhaeribacter swui]
MKRTYLGEFEEIVLLTVVALEGNAYGVALTHYITEQTGRSARLNQVHAALHRLEEKGMVTSCLGEATAERGGRRKRLFTITAYGEQTLLDIQAVRSQLINQLPRTLKPSLNL